MIYKKSKFKKNYGTKKLNTPSLRNKDDHNLLIIMYKYIFLKKKVKTMKIY